MKFLDNYLINFSGLKEGTHNFEIDINDKFFTFFEHSEITKGLLKVNISLQKQTELLLFEFFLKGSVDVICDRCLEHFNLSIDKTFKLMVKLGDKNAEISEDTIMIQETTHEINLAQFIYEYIHLCLPVQRTHPDDKHGESTCNKEMLKKLKELKEKSKETDPRWEKLKNIQLN